MIQARAFCLGGGRFRAASCCCAAIAQRCFFGGEKNANLINLNKSSCREFYVGFTRCWDLSISLLFLIHYSNIYTFAQFSYVSCFIDSLLRVVLLFLIIICSVWMVYKQAAYGCAVLRHNKTQHAQWYSFVCFLIFEQYRCTRCHAFLMWNTTAHYLISHKRSCRRKPASRERTLTCRQAGPFHALFLRSRGSYRRMLSPNPLAWPLF